MTDPLANAPRQSTRVLVIDALDRVLLLHMALRDGRAIWLPPGGGIEAGETAEHAALREVHEETGIALTSAGPCVWTRHTRFDGLDQSERFFFAHVSGTPNVVTNRNPEDAELAMLRGHRWWSLPEIVASEEFFVPGDLGVHLERLLAGELPDQPFDVGV